MNADVTYTQKEMNALVNVVTQFQKTETISPQLKKIFLDTKYSFLRYLPLRYEFLKKCKANGPYRDDKLNAVAFKVQKQLSIYFSETPNKAQANAFSIQEYKLLTQLSVINELLDPMLFEVTNKEDGNDENGKWINVLGDESSSVEANMEAFINQLSASSNEPCEEDLETIAASPVALEALAKMCPTKVGTMYNRFLQKALRKNNVAMLTLLVEGKGVSVNECFERYVPLAVVYWQSAKSRGVTPLHYATKHCTDGVVAYLLSRGAKADVCDIRGRTPLHLALGRCAFAKVQLLYDQGVTKFCQPQNVHIRTTYGLEQPLNYFIRKMYQRKWREDKDLVMESKDAGWNNRVPKKGPLDLNEVYKICEFILGKEININSKQLDKYSKPIPVLFFATGLGSKRLVQLLIDSKADVHASRGIFRVGDINKAHDNLVSYAASKVDESDGIPRDPNASFSNYALTVVKETPQLLMKLAVSSEAQSIYNLLSKLSNSDT